VFVHSRHAFFTKQHHIKPATLVVLLLIVFACWVAKDLSLPLPEVHSFLPMYVTAVVILESITGYLLLAQFATSRMVYPGFVASAYLFLVPLMTVQLMVFPGVFSATGLLNAGQQSAVWIWVFWHAGFPAFILLALAAEYKIGSRQIAVSHLKYWLWGFVLVPLVVGLALALFATWERDILPPLITDNSYRLLLHSPYALLVWCINFAALVFMLRRVNNRNVIYVWVCVALFASLIDVSLTLFAGSRFSLGWYAARLSSTVSSVVLLAALLWEINRLYMSSQKTNEQLYQQSMRDTLTGLFNRRYLDTQLAAYTEQMKRQAEPLALLMIDVDYFKQFNDTHGHSVGDYCLIQVARTLEKTLQRPIDFVARYGGEEFVVVLPYTDLKGAMQVAEQLRSQVCQLQLVSEQQSLEVTVSIGVALLQGKDWTVQQLLNSADQALYQAKAAGRNSVKAAAI
jgi:diguanylate cyclase (GGDEF)-like protein